MDIKTKEYIEKHIQNIIEEFKFENQKLKNPEKCICFKEGKCHDLKNLNCFFCYCPEYDNGTNEGGCKIDSQKGKWFVKGDKKIWDCSACDYPHKEEVTKKYLKKLFRI